MSAETTAAGLPRRRFRLDGPSVPLQPGRYAVRRDLAEIAVADRVFAQHYVEPWAASVSTDVAVRDRPDAEGLVVAELKQGDAFHVVDLGHQWAWGRGTAAGTVGYIAVSALNIP